MTALLPCNHEVHLKDCEVCGRSFTIINMPTESALRAENAKLREALEWYADTSNYDEGLAPVIITNIGSWYDHGYKAREALK